jgi:hypothetical protein
MNIGHVCSSVKWQGSRDTTLGYIHQYTRITDELRNSYQLFISLSLPVHCTVLKFKKLLHQFTHSLRLPAHHHRHLLTADSLTAS